MKKNGFTLVELLAVIVVLGVIMTIAGTAVMGQRKKANIEEAKNMEKTLADIGPDVYLKNNGEPNFKDTIKISAEDLKDAGYLSKSIENPAGGGNCDAWLVIDTDSNDEMFKGYIKCTNLYATGQSGEVFNDANYNAIINSIPAYTSIY